MTLKFRTVSENRGTLSPETPCLVSINSEYDTDVKISLTVKKITQETTDRWVLHQIEQLAKLFTSLENHNETYRKFVGQLLENKLDKLESQSEQAQSAISTLREQLNRFKVGESLSILQLSDLKYSSRFSGGRRKPSMVKTSKPIKVVHQNRITRVAHWETKLERYSRNNHGAKRNQLQAAICNTKVESLDPTAFNILEQLSNKTTDEVISCLTAVDGDGNNALQLAAYCGHLKIVTTICKLCSSLSTDEFKFSVFVNKKNPDNESALTLAIKKRGFNKTVECLLENGATMLGRAKQLERFAIDNDYIRTAEIISAYNTSTSFNLDTSMTKNYINQIYKRVVAAGKLDGYLQQYLEVALSKQMTKMVVELLAKGAKPNLQMMFKYCYPTKADGPDIPATLEMLKLLIGEVPELLHQADPVSGDNGLIISVRRGSLPHAKYFVSNGASVKHVNAKGCTALWVACYMRYPCLIDFLLESGADINTTNESGHGCLYGVCERGNLKIAEKLVGLGCDPNLLADCEDSTILKACRSGQDEVLEYLLTQVDEELIDHPCAVDGFAPIMSASESNQGACIKVLADIGVDINQTTELTNQILPLATPLHIACYYGRMSSVMALVELGANLDLQDLSGATGLHLAVMHKHLKIVKCLIDAGADTNILDKNGCYPVNYCSGDLSKALVSPSVDALSELTAGTYTSSDVKLICSDLSRLNKLLELPINVIDSNGSYPLINATKYGLLQVVKVLVQLGADLEVTDRMGLTAGDWSFIVNHRPIRKALGATVTDNITRFAKQMDKCRKVLFLGKCPANTEPPVSSISDRMSGIAFSSKPTISSTVKCTKMITDLFSIHGASFEIDYRCLWESMVHVASMVASNNVPVGMNPYDMLAVSMYGNSPKMFKQLKTGSKSTNMVLDKVVHALNKLPSYSVESFIGVEEIDRTQLAVGKTVCLKNLTSASSTWSVALKNCPRFSTKTKQGTILIIKSKQGKYIGHLTSFPVDGEVVYPANLKLKVTAWYHGDVIALGQPNIREHSYAVKETDDRRMSMSKLMACRKSLIICLAEA